MITMYGNKVFCYYIITFKYKLCEKLSQHKWGWKCELYFIYIDFFFKDLFNVNCRYVLLIMSWINLNFLLSISVKIFTWTYIQASTQIWTNM